MLSFHTIVCSLASSSLHVELAIDRAKSKNHCDEDTVGYNVLTALLPSSLSQPPPVLTPPGGDGAAGPHPAAGPQRLHPQAGAAR